MCLLCMYPSSQPVVLSAAYLLSNHFSVDIPPATSLVVLPGHLYPMEAHLVSLVSQSQLPSCPPEGCVVVTGVLFELSDDLTTGSDWLEPLFASMPLSEGVSAAARARPWRWHLTADLLAV